jgi:hypothetical protein
MLLKRSSLVVFASLQVVLGFGQWSEGGGPQDTQPAAASEDALNLASASANVLMLAASARDRMNAATRPPEGPDLLEMMTATRVAINRFAEAKLELRRSSESKDADIREAATALHETVDVLAGLLLRMVTLMEELVRATSEDQVAELSIEVSKVSAGIDEAWRLLPTAITVVAHALVDPGRNLDGKLAYMKLTRGQHRRVVAELSRAFPNAAQETGGGHAVDVSARLLMQFLNQGWRAADERTPLP